MTTNLEIKSPYHVKRRGCTYDCYETLEDAQAEARKEAWTNGGDYLIFKAIAVAQAPEELKNIAIKTL